MRLFARSLLVASAAGSLFVGPTAAAFAADADVAPPSVGQDRKPVKDVVDPVTKATHDVLGTGEETGDDPASDTGNSTRRQTSGTAGPGQLDCTAFGQLPDPSQQICDELAKQFSANPEPTPPDRQGPSPIEEIDKKLAPILKQICLILVQINEQLPPELKLDDITKQIFENAELKQLTDQIPENLRNTLLLRCGPDEAPGPKPKKKKPSTMDQPRPVSAATLPKTGGAPLWLIPLGLFLMALGSKLVWPVAKGR